VSPRLSKQKIQPILNVMWTSFAFLKFLSFVCQKTFKCKPIPQHSMWQCDLTEKFKFFLFFIFLWNQNDREFSCYLQYQAETYHHHTPYHLWNVCREYDYTNIFAQWKIKILKPRSNFKNNMWRTMLF
jgi:hypothetical protein